MMKVNFKAAILSLGIILASVLAYQNSSAEVGNNPENKKAKWQEKREDLEQKKEEKQAEMQAKFCERLSDLSSKIGKRIDTKEEKFQNREEEAFRNWEQKRSDRDAKLEEFRLRREENWEKHFAALEAKAQTDEQKEAVADFKTAVLGAVEARKTAVDAAIETFRTSADKLIETRKNGLKTAAQNFVSAQKEAFDEAKESCEKGTDPKTVRTNLHSALKAAREKFNAERQAVEKVGTSMQALVDARQQAFEKALSDFKAAMEKARADLLKVFPKDESKEAETE